MTFRAMRHAARCGLLVVVAGTPACAHAPAADPAQVTVTAEVVTSTHRLANEWTPLRVTVHNGSRARLRLSLDDEQGPPHALNWAGYRLYAVEGTGLREILDGSGNGPPGVAHVSVGRGDTVELSAWLYRKDDCATTFRIEVLAVARDGRYLSAPFRGCRTEVAK